MREVSHRSGRNQPRKHRLCMNKGATNALFCDGAGSLGCRMDPPRPLGGLRQGPQNPAPSRGPMGLWQRLSSKSWSFFQQSPRENWLPKSSNSSHEQRLSGRVIRPSPSLGSSCARCVPTARSLCSRLNSKKKHNTHCTKKPLAHTMSRALGRRPRPIWPRNRLGRRACSCAPFRVSHCPQPPAARATTPRPARAGGDGWGGRIQLMR